MKNKYNVFCLWTLIILVVSPSQATVVLDYHSRVFNCDTRESGQDLKLSCGDAFSRYEVNVYGVHESHPWTQVRGPIELSCKAQYTGSFVEQAEAYREIDRLIGDGEFKWVDANKKMQMGAQTTDLLILCDFIDAQKARTIFMKTDPDYRLETTLISQEDDSAFECACEDYPENERFVQCNLKGKKVTIDFSLHSDIRANKSIIEFLQKVSYLKKPDEGANQVLNNFEADTWGAGAMRKYFSEDYATYSELNQKTPFQRFAVEQSPEDHRFNVDNLSDYGLITRDQSGLFQRVLTQGLSEPLRDEMGIIFFDKIIFDAVLKKRIDINRVTPIGSDDLNGKTIALHTALTNILINEIQPKIETSGQSRYLKDLYFSVAGVAIGIPLHTEEARQKDDQFRQVMKTIFETARIDMNIHRRFFDIRSQIVQLIDERDVIHAQKILDFSEDTVFVQMGSAHRFELTKQLVSQCVDRAN